MTENVVEFTGVTVLDIPAEKVLTSAIREGLESVVVIGYGANGEEYFASSMVDADALFLVERYKRFLVSDE